MPRREKKEGKQKVKWLIVKGNGRWQVFDPDGIRRAVEDTWHAAYLQSMMLQGTKPTEVEQEQPRWDQFIEPPPVEIDSCVDYGIPQANRVAAGYLDMGYAAFVRLKTLGFQPPTGAGRCELCGRHVPAQGGHRDGCPQGVGR